MLQKDNSEFREAVSHLIKTLEVVNNNHFTKYSNYQYYAVSNGDYDYSNMLAMDARYTIGHLKFQATDINIRYDMLNQLNKHYPIDMKYAEFIIKEILKIYIDTGYATQFSEYKFKGKWLDYYGRGKKNFIEFKTKIFFDRIFNPTKYLNITTYIVFKTRKIGETYQVYPALMIETPESSTDSNENIRHTVSLEPNVKEICRITYYGHKIDVIEFSQFKEDINDMTYVFQSKSALAILRKQDHLKMTYKKFLLLSKKEQQDLIDLASMLNY